MDDEIDIEEHDVLDNPRIKSMFPDLARVKIEVPDQDNMDEEIPEEEEHQMLYQYDYGTYSEHDNLTSRMAEDTNTAAGEEYLTNETSEYDAVEPHHALTNPPESDTYITPDLSDPVAEYVEFDSTVSHVNSSAIERREDITSAYVPNTIIVGSRLNYDVLYEEALNSNSFVILEDWGDRIYNSPCYCHLCGTLFSTINALDAHKMVTHSYLVAVTNNTARKSTGFSPVCNVAKKSTIPGKLCNHCNLMFSDDTALIKHLYELLPMSNFNNVASASTSYQVGSFNNNQSIETASVTTISEKTTKLTDTTEYECLKCNKVFISNYKARLHRKLVHDEENLHGRRIFKILSEHGKDKRVKKKGIAYNSDMIPKSLLFHCVKCNIHIISAFSAINHLKMCSMNTKYHTCDVCHRKIIFRDVRRHSLQHKQTDRFKVYNLQNTSVYERVLCKCPKCSVCFDEMLFYRHAKCCNDVDYVLCTICNVFISSDRHKIHEHRHKYRKLGKKDFIIVEFFNSKDVINKPIKNCVKTKNCTLKSKDIVKAKNNTEGKNDTVVAKTKNTRTVDGKKNLYFCQYCGCCQNTVKYQLHANKKCLTVARLNRRICEYCGLIFRQKVYSLHVLKHVDKKLTVNDFNFINLATGEAIEPPIYSLHKCKGCKINFIKKQHMVVHNCVTESYKLCPFCNEKYETRAYKLHKEFHKDDSRTHKEHRKANKNDTKEIMPELLMKYNSLLSTWNIVYICSDCDVVTMTYDSAVRHAQDHITGTTGDSAYCSICNLVINNTCFDTHEGLHAQNDGLTRKSFNILKFDYRNLFKSSWMLLFEGLSAQDVDVILSRSVHKDVRSVKMNVSGSSDIVKYVCCACKGSVEDVKAHIEDGCNVKLKYRCRYCKNKFNGVEDLVSHENRHENNENSIKLVTFNENNDRLYNDKLKKYTTGCKVKQNIVKKFKLYCCRKCTICIVLKNNIYGHKCILESNRRYCATCECYFSYQNERNHKMAHTKFPNLCKDTISITYFGAETPEIKNKRDKPQSKYVKTVKPETKVETKAQTISYLYKCDCGLHFTSVAYVTKHIDVCGVEDLSSENCSKCHLLFPTDLLVTHLVQHHSNKTSKIITKAIVKGKVYQCSVCKILYPSRITIENHCCEENIGKKCDNCNLMYNVKYINKHKCHENSKELCINKIIQYKQKYKQIDVYNCGPCDINYWSPSGYKDHIRYKHRIVRTPIKCGVCNLKFTRKSFDQHMIVHAGYVKYKINVINEVNDSRTIEGDNIDMDEVMTRSKTGKDVSKISVIDSFVEDFDINDTSKDSEASVRSLKEKIVFEDEPSLSDSIKAKMNVNSYSNSIFKCPTCPLHFLNVFSLKTHKRRLGNGHCRKNEFAKCDLCGINFSLTSLPRHKYIHHEIMKFKFNDFVIIYDGNDKNKPDLTAVNIDDSNTEIDKQVEVDIAEGNTTDLVEFNEGSNLVEIDKAAELLGDDGDGNIDNTVEETTDNLKTNDNTIDGIADAKKEFRLFKCGQCYLCFMKQVECIKHVQKHVYIDPKMYIECKICNYQFLIGSLKLHMEKHHSGDFRTDKVLIEEHSTIDDSSATRIDVYFAVDRVQSRLVSTTTDVEKDC